MERTLRERNSLLGSVAALGAATVITILALPSLLEFVAFIPLFLTKNLNLSSNYCIGIGLFMAGTLGIGLGKLLSSPLELHNKIILSSIFSFALIVILCSLGMLIEMLSSA